jgi:hypothetical protein
VSEARIVLAGWRRFPGACQKPKLRWLARR